MSELSIFETCPVTIMDKIISYLDNMGDRNNLSLTSKNLLAKIRGYRKAPAYTLSYDLNEHYLARNRKPLHLFKMIKQLTIISYQLNFLRSDQMGYLRELFNVNTLRTIHFIRLSMSNQPYLWFKQPMPRIKKLILEEAPQFNVHMKVKHVNTILENFEYLESLILNNIVLSNNPPMDIEIFSAKLTNLNVLKLINVDHVQKLIVQIHRLKNIEVLHVCSPSKMVTKQTDETWENYVSTVLGSTKLTNLHLSVDSSVQFVKRPGKTPIDITIHMAIRNLSQRYLEHLVEMSDYCNSICLSTNRDRAGTAYIKLEKLYKNYVKKTNKNLKFICYPEKLDCWTTLKPTCKIRTDYCVPKTRRTENGEITYEITDSSEEEEPSDSEPEIIWSSDSDVEVIWPE